MTQKATLRFESSTSTLIGANAVRTFRRNITFRDPDWCRRPNVTVLQPCTGDFANNGLGLALESTAQSREMGE
jgi:hypothetical protein